MSTSDGQSVVQSADGEVAGSHLRSVNTPPVACVWLNASYVDDTMRLIGGLGNIGMWRSHAADLQVTLRGADCSIMQKTVIWPDDESLITRLKAGLYYSLLLRLDARPKQR